MSEETEVSYFCPHCENEVNITIRINGDEDDWVDDYYAEDECCPNCDASIDGGIIDSLTSDVMRDYRL